MRKRIGWVALAATLGTAAAATAGVEALKGRIVADGSSTVGPFTTAAAEMFQRRNSGVQVTVGISGTGGGFERFCRDESTSRTHRGRSGRPSISSASATASAGSP